MQFDRKSFNKGAAVKLSARFTTPGDPCDGGNEPIDPTTVTLRTIDPNLDQVDHVYDSLVVSPGEVARDGVGL